MTTSRRGRVKRGTGNGQTLVVRLTERDRWLLEALAKMRFLETGHLARLGFNDSRWAANKRLRRLFDAGLVRVWLRSLAEENVYSLDRRGASVLRNGALAHDSESVCYVPRGLDGRLDHLLGINTVRIGLALTLPKAGGELAWWRSDWELRGHRGRSRLVPDALFGVSWRDRQAPAFALEVDNATRAPRELVRKVLRYAAIGHRQMSFYGISDMALLVVGRDAEWLDRYRARLNHLGLGVPVWFATLEAAGREAGSGRIWLPADRDFPVSLAAADTGIARP
jgi:hypothetical protein